MKRSSLPSRNSIVFNGAAILIGGASLIFALKSSLTTPESENCSARYNTGTRMSFERGGAPLSADDLQSRLAGTDWGILDRAKIVKTQSGPTPLAMQVDLTGAKADDKNDDNGKEGVGFTWTPRSLGKVNGACLSYALLLPEGFDFGGGGRLPGLMGGRVGGPEASESERIEVNTNGIDGDGPFSARIVWREKGAGDVYAQIPALSEARSLGNDKSGFRFPLGSWVQVEQEVVLNEGNRKNGVLRVWIDGSLRYEKTNVAFRDTDKSKITGVMAEFVPTGKDFSATAKDQKILMTPFEVRWQKQQ